MRPYVVLVSDLDCFRNLDFAFLLEGLISRLAACANREASSNTPLTLPCYLHLQLPFLLAAGHTTMDT